MSLERWREIIGLPPLGFWQWDDGKPRESCSRVTREFSWQSRADANGRADFRADILRADDLLTDHLGFPVSRRWVTERIRLGARRGKCRLARTCYGHLRQIGSFRSDKITPAEGSVFEYRDDDGDGYAETLHIAVVGSFSGMSAGEFVLRHTDAVAGNGINDIWPRAVEITPTLLTLKVNAWEMARQKLYLGFGEAKALDRCELANYADTYDLYREWTDAAAAITVGTDACRCGSGCGDGCVGCCTTAPAARIHDCELGIVEVDACDADWVELSYEAGADACAACAVDLAGVHAHLAASLSMSGCCECEEVNGRLSMWRVDFALVQSLRAGGTQIADAFRIRNALGSTKAAVEAWQAVLRHKRPAGARA